MALGAVFTSKHGRECRKRCNEAMHSVLLYDIIILLYISFPVPCILVSLCEMVKGSAFALSRVRPALSLPGEPPRHTSGPEAQSQ